MGFTARSQSQVRFDHPDELRAAVVAAFTWSSRVPSPFIAVFSDREHATRWAISCHQREQGQVTLAEVDTSRLTNVRVLKLSTLVQELAIVLAEGAAQHEEGAYLCLRQIPRTAIVSITSASELIQPKDELKVQSKSQARRMSPAVG
jgi:hypothetical protein